MMPNITNQ